MFNRVNSDAQSQLWRCGACDTQFERGVAADCEGQPRCLTEAVPIGNDGGEFVMTRGTKFR